MAGWLLAELRALILWRRGWCRSRGIMLGRVAGLNDVLVVDHAPLANYWEKGKPLPAKGPIELQHHGDRLWFKNNFIRELPD